jgi:serine/threonine protein kinase
MTGGGAKGTLRWIAPELLDADKPRTHLSDIYALAITIWEVRVGSGEVRVHILTSDGTSVQVFTSTTPFSHIRLDHVVVVKVLSGERPPKPVDCESVGFSNELWDVVKRAWDAEPESRASLADFIQVLERKT